MELYLVEMEAGEVENKELYVIAESFNKARELVKSEHLYWDVVSIEIIANKNMSNLIMEVQDE